MGERKKMERFSNGSDLAEQEEGIYVCVNTMPNLQEA